MNIYIGNLHPAVTEHEVQQLFTYYGKVSSVKIIRDFETDISRGYGFVEMTEREDGQKAINGLKGSSLKEQLIEISVATPRLAPVSVSSFKIRSDEARANGNSYRKR